MPKAPKEPDSPLSQVAIVILSMFWNSARLNYLTIFFNPCLKVWLFKGFKGHPFPRTSAEYLSPWTMEPLYVKHPFSHICIAMLPLFTKRIDIPGDIVGLFGRLYVWGGTKWENAFSVNFGNLMHFFFSIPTKMLRIKKR